MERVRKGVGLGAVMLLLITPEFVFLFSGLGIDVPVMAVGATMLYLLQRRDVPLFRFCGIFFLLMLGAFLIRGPLGVMLPCAGVCGSFLATRKWKKFIAAGFTGAAAGIIGTASCLGLILLTGGKELLDWFVESQFLERVSHGSRNPLIFLELYVAMSPAAIVSLSIFLHSRRRIFSRPAAGWIGFLVLSLLLMVFPSRVHTRYLAMLLPCWALLGAYAWSCGRPGRWFRNVVYPRVGPLLDHCYRSLGCLAVLILAAAGLFITGAEKQPWGHYLAAMLLIVSIPFWTRAALIPFRPLLASAIVLFAALTPFIAANENSRIFTRTVESARTGRLWFLEMGPDHDDLKYLLHTDPEKRASACYAFFELPELTSMYQKMYKMKSVYEVMPHIRENDVIVLRNRKYETNGLRALAEKHKLRPVIVASGTLGHRDCIAVRLLPF